MGILDSETRTCPDCGKPFDALAIWDKTVPCDECGRKRYEARMEHLRAGRDYTIDELGGACPTQAMGRTADGRPYYFRARHGEWTLEVGEHDFPTDYSDWPASRHDADHFLIASGDDESHGWMNDSEVLAILDEHLAVPCPECRRTRGHKFSCSRRRGKGLRFNAKGKH